MRRALVLAAGFALAQPLAAQEIVTVKAREGATQSFFLANMGGVKPEAAALLFIGGGGNIRLRTEDGQVKFGAGNFLPRARAEFIRNGIQPVIMDVPSDQNTSSGMSDGFRMGDEHLADVRAVVAEVKKRFPGLPVFLVGTSRSTVSIAYLARRMGPDEVKGGVLSASLFRAGTGPRAAPMLGAFDWSEAKLPLLFVHHRDDACGATPYATAASLAARFPLVSVKGGKAPESGPCDPYHAHGFWGMEAPTVDAIAAWMLGKPFSKEIE
jgi:hypothetical protein